MIKPAEAFIDVNLEIDDEDCSFARIGTVRNRSMPVGSHSSSSCGKRRSGSRRKRRQGGMHNRFNKKVLHGVG